MEIRRKKYEYHNMSKTKIYRVWKHMKERCNNELCKEYSMYGGRGIEICKEWNDSFVCFYNDMIDGYSEKLEIDRIDNNGNYCKDNCRWVTRAVNVSNRRYKSRYMKGVDKTSKNSRFRAKITIDNVQYIIGRFDTEAEAHNAFLEVHREWYGK